MAASSTKENSDEKIYEQKWEIRNWENIYKNRTLIESTKTEIECKENNVFYATFLVGFKICRIGDRDLVRFYWKLIQEAVDLSSVKADLNILVLKNNGSTWYTFKSEANLLLGNDIEIKPGAWLFPTNSNFASSLIRSDGSCIIRLKLTLKNSPDQVIISKDKTFTSVCKDDFVQKMAALVNNNLCSDVKILTKDNKELFAHKAVLCAQCPVFASMFTSDFSERSSGVVNVTDISSKTMKILLHFWYTAELLPSYKDDETVVEFTYAAGKYEMTQVLIMLDNVLGQDMKANDNIVELLVVANQLSLKTAEHAILKRVVDRVNEAKNATELLDLFLLTSDNFDESGFTFPEALKAFDDVLSENNVNEICSRDIQLMALACKHGVKNVEKKLFNRVVDAVKKVGSTEKLFALFEINKKKVDGSKKGNLLVRANSK